MNPILIYIPTYFFSLFMYLECIWVWWARDTYICEPSSHGFMKKVRLLWGHKRVKAEMFVKCKDDTL